MSLNDAIYDDLLDESFQKDYDNFYNDDDCNDYNDDEDEDFDDFSWAVSSDSCNPYSIGSPYDDVDDDDDYYDDLLDF